MSVKDYIAFGEDKDGRFVISSDLGVIAIGEHKVRDMVIAGARWLERHATKDDCCNGDCNLLRERNHD
jgi:hypothetical protein